MCFFLPRIFSTTCGRALQAEKMQLMQMQNATYASFKRLRMVLAIYLSFIDLIQLYYITDLSKVSAKNGPHRHAGRVSLASTRCLQLS